MTATERPDTGKRRDRKGRDTGKRPVSATERPETDNERPERATERPDTAAGDPLAPTAEPKAFSWGPERRSSPSSTGVLAALVVVLLAAGVFGAATVHPKKSAAPPTATTQPVPSKTTTPAPTTTVATPAGYTRLTDAIDHLSLAVPGGWQAPGVTNNSLASALQAMKAQNPTLAPLLDNALGALTSIQVGVFAVEVPSRTTLYAYGMDVPGVTSADQLSATDVAKQVQAVGGKNVQVTVVHLPIAGAGQVAAGQVSAQLTVNKVTIAEALDYFVINARLISIVVSTRGTKPPLTVLHQIEPTLAHTA